MCEISVCIPVYNGERFIKKSIESVLNQTYSNFELLIIDNCSTDDTVSIVKSFNDKRIRFIQNETNLGMIGNWNKCIKESKGKYINIVCADDRLKEDCLEKKVKMMTENDDVVFVFSGTDVIDETGKVILKRNGLKRTGVYSGMKIFKKSLRTRNIFGEPTNVLFNKDMIDSDVIYSGDLPYSPDWEFWLRLSTFGNVGFYKESLAEFRVSTVSTTDKILKDRKKLKVDSKRFFDNVSKYAEVKKLDIFLNRLYQRIRTFEKKVFFIIIAK